MAGTLGVATLQTDVDLSGLDKGLGSAETKSKQSFKGSEIAGKAAYAAVAAAGVAAMLAATAAVVDFAQKSLEAAQGFEKGMSEVFTLMPAITTQAMGRMEADVLAFGASVGRLSGDTVPALYQSISAGVPSSNVLDFMKIASDAALGGVTELETAVDVLSTATNAYGVENLAAQEASDLLFTAVKGGKTTFDELGASLFNVIPTAASLGVEFGNVTAAIASMTAQGTPTAQATTQLRQLLVELSKEGSEAAAVFERIAGKSFVEFIAQGGNLQQALQIMEQAAADSDLRLSDMFSSVEAGNAALTLTGAGTAKFAAELAAAETATGATAEAAETMAGTQEHLDARIAATTEQLQILIGQALSPTAAGLKEVKLAALEAATAFLTYKVAAGEVIADNAVMANDFEGLVAEAQGLITIASGFNLVESAAAGVSGQTAVMRDRVEEILGSLTSGVSTWEEYEAAVLATTGASKIIESDFGDLMVSVEGLGNVWLGNREQLEGLIGQFQLSETATNDYNQEILNQTSLTNQLLPVTAERIRQLQEEEAANYAAAMAGSELGDKTVMLSNFISEEEGHIRGLNQQNQRNIEIQREAALAAAEHAAAVDALNRALVDNFVSALNSSEGIGFYNESMDELGQHSAFVSDMTTQQTADLTDLQGAYDKAAEKVRDYELGIAGANLTDEERAEKIQEQQEIMAGLAPNIEALNAVGGEYVSWTTEATVNQERVNQALFDAVAATTDDAASLAILGGALGLYSEEATEAALKSALIQAKIDELAAAYVSGAVTVGGMQESLANFIAGLDAVGPAADTAAGSVGTATAALSEQDAALAEKLGVFDEQATTASGSAVTAFGEIEAGAETHMPAAASIVDENAQAILSSVDTAFGEMAGAAETHMGEVVSATGVNLEEAAVTAEGYVVRFGDVGAGIGQTMTSTLLAEGGALSNAAAQIVLDALAAAEAAAEAQSPSRRAMRLSDDIIEGLVMQLMAGETDLKEVMALIASGAFDALEEEIEEGGIDAAAALEDIIERMFDTVQDTLSAGRRLGGISEFFAGMILDPAQEALDTLDERLAGAADTLADSLGGFLPDLSGDLDAMIAAAEAAGNPQLADALREYQALQQERNAAEADYIAAQERLLEIQEQQQQLAFLQNQLDLIQQLREAGLDPAAVLGGIPLGLDASPEDLLNASQAALAALIGQANIQLGQVGGVIASGGGPTVGPSVFQGGPSASTLSAAAPTLSGPTPSATIAANGDVTIYIDIDARGAAPGVGDEIADRLEGVLGQKARRVNHIVRTR